MSARQRGLLRTAWMLTGDWGVAEDLVQSALARTWQRWASVTRRDAPELYVRRVLVTTYATWWRRKWRGEWATAELPEGGPPTASGDDQAVQRLVVRSALAGLPRRQRAVVVLRFFDDLTERETAEALGCSIGTVKSQTAKAIEKLRADPDLRSLQEVGHP